MKRKGLLIVGGVVVLVVAAVLGVTLSLSSSGPAADGPFGPARPTTGEDCFESPGQVVTYSFEDVTNGGSSDATIQHASYVNPRNLQVIQTFTIPARDDLSYAEEWGYPPQWMLRERSIVLRPRHEYEVVMVTRLIGQEGRADAVLVNYSEAGSQYVLRTITALEIKRRPLKCDFAQSL
jgi:hypothetical protein